MRIEACLSAQREKRRLLRGKGKKNQENKICAAWRRPAQRTEHTKNKDLHPIRGVRGGLRVDVLLHQLQREYLYFCTINKYSCTSPARTLRPAGQSLGSLEELQLACPPPHTASFRGIRHSQWSLRPAHSPASSCTPRELACLHMFFPPELIC